MVGPRWGAVELSGSVCLACVRASSGHVSLPFAVASVVRVGSPLTSALHAFHFTLESIERASQDRRRRPHTLFTRRPAIRGNAPIVRQAGGRQANDCHSPNSKCFFKRCGGAGIAGWPSGGFDVACLPARRFDEEEEGLEGGGLGLGHAGVSVTNAREVRK